MKNKILLYSCLPLTLMSVNAQKTASKPNIVFILVDDMGWKDLDCYGNTFNETPHIDSLSNSGIRFSQAYSAAPISSPTRASILTGKHPATLKLTNFIGGNRIDPNSTILPAISKQYLESKETTLAEVMKENGYVTGMVGKWHLGYGDSVAPWGQGFDYTRMIVKKELDYYNYSIAIDTYENEFIDHGTNYLTDKLTEYGVNFIQKNSEKPFFLYLAYSAPHVMIVPKAEKNSKYLLKYEYNKNSKAGAGNPYYAAMIESLDDGVGKIIQSIRDASILENTIIVFASDNGGLGTDELGPTPTSNSPLRKWKGHLYEGGIRVPTIISWKSHIDAGITSDYYFSSIDYLPTLCELASIKELPYSVSGKSIVPVLLNPQKTTFKQDTLFWHYPHFSNQGGRPSAAIRYGDYKLVENFETNKYELYNLKNDIAEKHNIAEKQKAKSIELYNMLTAWKEKNKVEMPIKIAKLAKKQN